MGESSEVDALEYIKILIKRKRLIIVAVIVCLALALILTHQTEPAYEATAKLYISQDQFVLPNQPSSDRYQAMLLNEELAKTFSEILRGRVVAEGVIARLDLPERPAQLMEKISAEPIRETQLIELTIEYNNSRQAARIANTMTEEFSRIVKSIEATENDTATTVKVVEPAVEPDDPVRPRPLLNLIVSLLIGLIFGTGLALLVDRLDTSVKDPEEIEELTGMISLGMIPAARARDLLVSENPMSPLSEAFRRLRTNMHFLNFNQSAKTLVITSPGVNEGKTTLGVNLATVLAHAGNKVLVIDGDLRRPKIHEVCGLPNDAGLSNILAGDAAAGLVALPSQTVGLSIITSGPIPPNPTELLSSKRMDDFIKTAAEVFDFVIIDSPPVLAVADAVVLASKVDGVILTAAYGKTSKHAIVASKSALDRVEARILGFVLNGVRLRDRHGYDFGYYRKPESERNAKREETSKPIDHKPSTSFAGRFFFVATFVIVVLSLVMALASTK